MVIQEGVFVVLQCIFKVIIWNVFEIESFVEMSCLCFWDEEKDCNFFYQFIGWKEVVFVYY